MGLLFKRTAEEPRSSAAASAEPVYPSYVDFDPFLDVARLRSLDLYLRDRLERRIQRAKDLQFYTGPFLLDGRDPYRPGSRMVYLARSTREDSYYDLDDTDLWVPSEEVGEFAELVDFIATLPFEATGRILIMYDDGGAAVPAHRDHDDTGVCHEFVWFRTNFDKPFYMLDPETGEKLYVSSHSAWFDTVNQFHGADGRPGLTWSIRVDGRFSDTFRRLIPEAPGNPASRAACWAAEHLA
jgi:hypothetical protein